MDLRTYLPTVPIEDRDSFAAKCETTMGHLRNVMYGFRPCSPELAAGIERASAGQVTRRDMRPNDWHLIWPELVEPAADPTPTGIASQAAGQGV